MCCVDQRQATAVSERPSTTTGITAAAGDASRDSPSPCSRTASPPPRRRSSPSSSVDVDTRHKGAPLPYHVTQRPTSGHVTTPDVDSKVQEESLSGVRFDVRHAAVAEIQQQQLMRAGQHIISGTGPTYGVDSLTLQHHQHPHPHPHPHHQQQPQQQSSSYDMVAGDARWLLHGQYPPRTAFGPGPGRSCVDYNTSSGYSGSLVGNATPSLTRRATVEYRVQPPITTTTGSAVHSMDYPPLHFASLPFQATAAYGKQSY